MSTRPVLLLNVMDTLVHDPFYVEVLEFFGMDLDTLFTRKSKDAWKRFECGEMSEARLVHEYFIGPRELDLQGLRACMQPHYRWLEGIEPLLADLRERGVEMHALSNYPIWWEMIEARLGVSRYVEWSFVSCKTGVRKPDPQSYIGAACAVGREPRECVFVDDRAKNCRGAEAVDMPAIRFVSAGQLRTALTAAGML